MRKAFLSLTAAVIAFGAPVLSVSSASAASSPTMGCNIQPSGSSNFGARCGTGDPSTTYTVTDGCTSTSDECAISVHHGESDQDLTASVTVTQNGTSTTLSSTAIINAVCGDDFC
jgi:hypothetical protein